LGGGPSGMEPFEAAPPRGFRLNRKVYVKTVRHLDDMPMYLPTNRDGVAFIYRCNEVALVMPFLFFFSPLCARLFSCCFLGSDVLVCVGWPGDQHPHAILMTQSQPG